MPNESLAKASDAEKELSAVLERELLQLIGDEPQRIYHYTSIEGLVGIANEQRLYLSDVRTSHDLSELKFGAQVVGATLKRRWPDDPVAQAFVKAVEEGRWWGLGEDLLVYAMCFCAEPDSLAQWRGFAPSSGVAIEFDFGMLRRRAEQVEREAEFGLGKIHYQRGDQETLISRVFETARDLMSRLDTAGRKMFMFTIGIKLLSLALYFKHEAFSSEREWRILQIQPSSIKSKFRSHRGRIIPYLELECCDAITGIRRCPGYWSDADIHGLNRLAKALGNVPVLPSDLPL